MKVCRIAPCNGVEHKFGENILNNLKDSEILNRKKFHVQDPYCFRCIPQVHGASKDAINYAEKVVETEIN